MANENLALAALRNLLKELRDGPSDHGAWLFARDNSGLIDSLRSISAENASRHRPDRKSIAAHAAHIQFSLRLLNRWASGEPNPFANADYSESWQPVTVNEAAWNGLINDLRNELNEWIDAIQCERSWDEIAFTGALASAAHIAYHLGEIRQLTLQQQPA